MEMKNNILEEFRMKHYVWINMNNFYLEQKILFSITCFLNFWPILLKSIDSYWYANLV